MFDKLCYTLYELAIKLQRSRSKLYSLVGAEDGPTIFQIGKPRMVTAESVAKWISEREQAAELLRPFQPLLAANRRRPCH
jgi:hypothetical protein